MNSNNSLTTLTQILLKLGDDINKVLYQNADIIKCTHEDLRRVEINLGGITEILDYVKKHDDVILMQSQDIKQILEMKKEIKESLVKIKNKLYWFFMIAGLSYTIAIIIIGFISSGHITIQ